MRKAQNERKDDELKNGLLQALSAASVCKENWDEEKRIYRSLEEENCGFGGNDGTIQKEGSDAQLEAKRKLLVKSSWSLAIQPGKNLMMNAVMIYMGGPGAGFFSIIILGYAMLSAVQQLMALNRVFLPLEPTASGVKINLFFPKLLYLVCTGAFIVYFLFHTAKMGFLPLSNVTLTNVTREPVTVFA